MKLNIKKIEICQANSGLTWKSRALPSSTSPPSTPLVPLISCQNFAALSQSSFTPLYLFFLPNWFFSQLLYQTLSLVISFKLLSFSNYFFFLKQTPSSFSHSPVTTTLLNWFSSSLSCFSSLFFLTRFFPQVVLPSKNDHDKWISTLAPVISNPHSKKQWCAPSLCKTSLISSPFLTSFLPSSYTHAPQLDSSLFTFLCPDPPSNCLQLSLSLVISLKQPKTHSPP